MKNVSILLLLMTFLLLGGCSTLVPVPEHLPIHGNTAPLTAYAQVLQNYVNERGEVNFPALQKHRTELDIYVAYVAGFSPNSDSNPNQSLAHYINSYNALSIYNVLASGIPKTHAGLAKIRFFYLRKLRIGGKEMSLYAYEDEVIRKLNEPRVHFALNCSALGCPTLPRTPFTATGLHRELDREAHKFFSESRNLRIDHANKTVYLSELLDFYTEDFISKATPTLIAYVNQYSPDTIPEDYAVEFIPYDWTVANSAR
jgi:uncharacterized protein YceK